MRRDDAGRPAARLVSLFTQLLAILSDPLDGLQKLWPLTLQRLTTLGIETGERRGEADQIRVKLSGIGELLFELLPGREYPAPVLG